MRATCLAYPTIMQSPECRHRKNGQLKKGFNLALISSEFYR